MVTRYIGATYDGWYTRRYTSTADDCWFDELEIEEEEKEVEVICNVTVEGKI